MLYHLFGILLLAAPLAAMAPPTHKTETVSSHKHVTGAQLKSWYEQNRPMTVLDARTKPYFDGTLLPQAKWLPSDSSDKQILAAIPSKDSLIVVYCYGVSCPASGWLYDKLTSMGYTNVYEYHEGLQDWMKRGYSTTKQE